MYSLQDFLIELIVTVIIFLILFTIGKFIYNKVSNSNNRFLNPTEYLPEEEIHSLKQVYYLIMMLILFIFILYSMIFYENDVRGLVILEIIITTYIAVTLDYSSWKNRFLLVLLIPYGSIAYIAFSQSVVGIMDFLHILGYAYFMKMYYRRFREYTETNGLGITIILLFTIILISFIITTIAENTEPLNALVMVSNAFTSNGYAVLGSTSIGKLNSLLLVWGGYIISGAGTATLTTAIILKYTRKREDELNKRLDDLEELIKNNQK